MTFSEVFIRRPIATTLLMVVVGAFGVWAYFRLPVNSLPTVDYPVIQVRASYPGASASTMASAVAIPLENEFTTINGLQSMISDNKEGSTTINLTFALDRDVDLVAPDVQAAISRADRNLPKDLPDPPSYAKFNPSDSPIFYLVLYSDTLTHGDLYDYANQVVARKLGMLDGVSEVRVFGAKRAVRVRAEPERLAAYGIGMDELAQALRAGTVNIPGGSLNGPDGTFSIEPRGQLRKASEYADLVVAYRDGAPVHLRDIAQCTDSIVNDLVNIRLSQPDASDHDRCVVMAISRVSGANTVKVGGEITRTLQTVRAELPGAVDLEPMYNGATPIRESLRDVQITILIALTFVILVIFAFLGRIRETLVPALVLPLAISGTNILMLLNGFNLDTLSLMGIVLAVGFLVDDGIVVLENTVRHIEEGKRPIPAAIKSMQEITFTVISTSAALIIVFTPLVFMSGAVGRNLREFALTVIFAIIASTILALTLSPMMCARMLRRNESPSRFQSLITATVGAMVRGYGRALHWQLRHKWVSALAWALCIAGTVVVFRLLPQTFLPKGDSSFIRGAMVMPQGASSDQMREFQRQVAAIVRRQPGVERVGTVTGFQPGADQSLGFAFIRLVPPSRRKHPIDWYIQQLSGKLSVLPYGFCFLQASPVLKISSGAESTASGSDYAYLLRGLDRDHVYGAASKLEQAMRGIPGVVGVQNNIKLDVPSLAVTIDRDRASALGLSAQAIEQTLALAYAGGYVTQFTTDNDQYQVILETDDAHRRSPEGLADLYLRSPATGELVPLRSVASWDVVAGPQNVPHAQQMESATLSFSLAPGVPLGDATAAIERKAAGLLPVDVVGRFTGDALEFRRSVASLGILLLVAIFLNYIVLGILYESYIHPFTILTTLPVAAFGGLLTVLLFGRELSLYAYIGLFVLIGLITKNGILMVDFARQRKNEGMNSYDAIHDACVVRFRPILMTGLCAIFGTLPIALGFGADGSSRVPLGLMVVGGMIFAQAITLFVTPGIYLYMEQFQARFLRPRTGLE